MAAMEALASAYGDDSDSEGSESPEEEVTPDHTAHLKSGVCISQLQSKIQLKSAPTVTAKVGHCCVFMDCLKLFCEVINSW